MCLFARALEDAKLAALAEFAAGAGHEINNPLATIVGRVQALLKHETDPGRRQSLATIAAQAFRIRDMIGDLMVFARPPAPVPERLLVNDAVSRDRRRAFRTRPASAACSPDVPRRVDRLCQHRSDAAGDRGERTRAKRLDAVGPAGGTIQVSVAAATVDGQPYAVTIVADNGRGL